MSRRVFESGDDFAPGKEDIYDGGARMIPATLRDELPDVELGRAGHPSGASAFASTPFGQAGIGAATAFALPQSAGAGTSAAAAAGTLPTYSNASIATYLRDGYWNDVGDTPHAFNMGSTGLGANSGVLRYDVGGLSASGIALAERAFTLYGEVLGIAFQRTGASGSGADIVFENTDRNAAATTANYYTDNGAITVASVNIGSGWISKYGTGTDSYSYQTFLHEIGHALGLGHAGNYDGAATYVTRTSDPDYGDGSNLYLNDSWQTSVMSYFSQTDNTSVTADRAFTLSPMVADWMALGQMYDGAGGFAGNTTWGFNTTITRTVFSNLAAYADDMAFTIIDGGGRDTVDFSGFGASQRIDLNAQKFSSVGGLTGNMSIASGTVIENATGGAGADTLTGNAAANLLKGMAGSDRILGNSGADSLRGGAGADTLTGGTGADVLTGGTGADVFRLIGISDSPASGSDVLRAGDGGAAFDGAGSAAGDRIDLSTLDANTGASGNQAFLFGGTARGHLWLTADGADTVVKGNVDASAGSDFQLVIEDGATLASAYQASDFLL